VWLAGHDHLTGLPNRRSLEVHLETALRQARDTSKLTAFIFVDIDNFKRVNDDFGHDVGDQLLKDFVTRLRTAIGDAGIIARLAGDEFAIILDEVTSRQNLEDILEDCFASIRSPFDLNTPSLTITCSAGAALCAGDEQISEVLRITDKAMYRAKHDGKNRYSIVHI
jgi:diguanylate cyclase (GGDEF)-like protein